MIKENPVINSHIQIYIYERRAFLQDLSKNDSMVICL